jgi:MYXO-CTERM domain-containing protein
MKRISRHTAVAILVVLIASLGGLGVAVTAFGQDASTSTPADPLSGYTPTTATTPPPATVPRTTPSAVTTPSGEEGSPVEGDSGANKPSRTHGSTKTPVATVPPTPSRATRDAPTTLAFTGADPLVLGGGGVLLMLAGLGLHRRRRRAGSLRV